jgi:hypothetical protein
MRSVVGFSILIWSPPPWPKPSPNSSMPKVGMKIGYDDRERRRGGADRARRGPQGAVADAEPARVHAVVAEGTAPARDLAALLEVQHQQEPMVVSVKMIHETPPPAG